MKKIKLNNKGFAITSIIYSMLILAIILMTLIILTLTRKKLLFNKMRDQLLYLKEYTINYYCNVLDEEEPYDTGIMYTNASRALKKYDSTKCSNGSYFFAGWTTDKNSTDVVYKDEEIVELENVKEDDVVNLYAVWKALKVDLNVTSATAVNNVTPSVTLTATTTPGLNEIAQYDFYANNVLIYTIKTTELIASISTENLNVTGAMNFKVVVSDSEGNTAESEITESCSEQEKQGVCTLRTDERNRVYVCNPTNRYYSLSESCCYEVCVEEAVANLTAQAQECSANGGGSECDPSQNIWNAQYGYYLEVGDTLVFKGCPAECQEFKVELSAEPVFLGDFSTSEIKLTATTKGNNEIANYYFYADDTLINTVTTNDLTTTINTSNLKAADMTFTVIVEDVTGQKTSAQVVESCSYSGTTLGVCYPNVESVSARYVCSGSNRYYKQDVQCGAVSCELVTGTICESACNSENSSEASCGGCKQCHEQYGCLAYFTGNC